MSDIKDAQGSQRANFKAKVALEAVRETSPFKVA